MRYLEYAPNFQGRIGGNIPELLISLVSDNLYFYATFEHPNKKGIMFSIFTPKDFGIMNDNNIYPNCSVKVIQHKFSKASDKDDFTNPNIREMSISAYKKLEEDYYSIREENQKNFDLLGDDFEELEEPEYSIVIGRRPILIQDDDIYTKDLDKDGYEFFMQIDEAGMPEKLIKKKLCFWV
ncbi:hypothetical protein [Pasteurella sp. PK-2025]|uniref:hypothetical protein n=1 Tax=Pasteurella sp. PK-2025 TaxID=3413133 RepID=UPI003C772B3E